MNLRNIGLLALLVGTTIHHPAFGQESNELEKWFTNAGSIKLADVRNAVSEFKRQVRDLNTKYANAFDERRSALSERLEEARLDATKSDKLDTAVQIRDLQKSLASLSLNPSEQVLGDAPNNDAKHQIADVVGSWRGNWGTTGAACLLAIDDKGNVMNENEILQLALQNGRLLAVGASKHQNLEVIPSGDRIIVLGWTSSKRKNPLVDQPDHVAILTRIDGRTKR